MMQCGFIQGGDCILAKIMNSLEIEILGERIYSTKGGPQGS